MAQLYKLYKNKNTKSAAYGKWYARSVWTGTTDLRALAKIIQRNSTAKYSDVLAVLTELVEVMQDELQNSHRVKIDGLGTFKIGLSTEGVNLPGDFTVQKNLKNAHIIFQPEVTIDRATNKRVKALLTGLSVQEAPKNDVDTSQKSDPDPEP